MGLFLGADEDDPLRPAFLAPEKYSFNRVSQSA
jgi:hypothetical protein